MIKKATECISFAERPVSDLLEMPQVSEMFPGDERSLWRVAMEKKMFDFKCKCVKTPSSLCAIPGHSPPCFQ